MQSPFVACQSKVECLDFKTNISYSVGNAQSQRKAILWRPDKRQHLTSIMSVSGYCGQFITFSLGLESWGRLLIFSSSFHNSTLQEHCRENISQIQFWQNFHYNRPDSCDITPAIMLPGIRARLAKSMGTTKSPNIDCLTRYWFHRWSSGLLSKFAVIRCCSLLQLLRYKVFWNCVRVC